MNPVYMAIIFIIVLFIVLFFFNIFREIRKHSIWQKNELFPAIKDIKEIKGFNLYNYNESKEKTKEELLRNFELLDPNLKILRNNVDFFNYFSILKEDIPFDVVNIRIQKDYYKEDGYSINYDYEDLLTGFIIVLNKNYIDLPKLQKFISENDKGFLKYIDLDDKIIIVVKEKENKDDTKLVGILGSPTEDISINNKEELEAKIRENLDNIFSELRKVLDV